MASPLIQSVCVKPQLSTPRKLASTLVLSEFGNNQPPPGACPNFQEPGNAAMTLGEGWFNQVNVSAQCFLQSVPGRLVFATGPNQPLCLLSTPCGCPDGSLAPGFLVLTGSPPLEVSPGVVQLNRAHGTEFGSGLGGGAMLAVCVCSTPDTDTSNYFPGSEGTSEP